VGWELAQLNIARLAAPIDDPQIDDFRIALPEINGLGERSAGFVWRLVGAGDTTGATDLRWPDAPDDPRIIVNLTVWTDLESLRAFAYRSTHVDFFKRRREWFVPEDSAVVLWWVPAGHRPTLIEANDRLRRLRAEGPSVDAFTFAHAFAAEN
jgi:hypothetical protein